MSEAQSKPPQRVWKCAACARVVQAVRNGAGAIVCAECGKEDQVPFLPRNDKPVYCSECFEQVRVRR